MNRYIKAGLEYAVPGLISIPIVIGICGIGYLVDTQIDPSSSGIFFYWWALIFIILFVSHALIGFIIGIICEYKSNKNIEQR